MTHRRQLLDARVRPCTGRISLEWLASGVALAAGLGCGSLDPDADRTERFVAVEEVTSSLWQAKGAKRCGDAMGDELHEQKRPNQKRPNGWWRSQAPNFGTYNVHLESTVRFTPLAPNADVERGRALFGVHEDLETEVVADALFEGPSVVFGGEVVSNGRTCFTCHRGASVEFGLPDLPLSDHVDADDPLFTGVAADAGDDPRAPKLLNELGLIKYKINRFNAQRDEEDPFRQVFAWRKTPNLLNLGLSHGLLTDGRARVLFEAARGAVFSHTQDSDQRFDDLFTLQDGLDMEAFLFGLFTDDALADLRKPDSEGFERLTEDPFSTVNIRTVAQYKGSKLFERQCMDCHSTPNVFNNLDNVLPEGNGSRPPLFPSFAPSVGRMFNIGVSERNAHRLDFRRHVGGDEFEPIELPLVDAAGRVQLVEVRQDIGLAATTARLEDVGRFKVPHLRGLVNNAPYFHDNSASTIEEALDHHLSWHYRQSPDGKRFPIRLGHGKRLQLIEFLKIL